MDSEAVSQILGPPTPPQTEVASSVEGGVGKDAGPSSSLKDEKLSSRIEVLIRREQAALARERAAKEKEAEIEAKFGRIKEFESVKDNPKKALEMLGLNYDELTKSILNEGQIPPEVEIRKLREEWQQERERQEEEKRQALEREQKLQREREEQTISTFKQNINQYLADNKERYELIDFEGAHELVFDVIDAHYERTKDPETGVGKILSIQEAADKVEEHLEKKYLQAKDRSKVKALWNMLPKEVQKEVARIEQRPADPRPKTLTNQLGATPAQRKAPITDEERIQRAIAYAKGLRP